MLTVTSVQAQNGFGKLLDSALREPVVVTRHGRAAAFIVSPRDMDELMTVRRKRSKAVQEFEALFAQSDQRLKPAAGALTEDEIVKLVRKSR